MAWTGPRKRPNIRRDGNSYTSAEKSEVAHRAVWGYLTEHTAAKAATDQGAYPYGISKRTRDLVVPTEAGKVFHLSPDEAPYYMGYLGQHVLVQMLSRYDMGRCADAHYYDGRNPELCDFCVSCRGCRMMVKTREPGEPFTQIPVKEIADLHIHDLLPKALISIELRLEERSGVCVGWLDPSELLLIGTLTLSESQEEVWRISDDAMLPLDELPCTGSLRT